MASNKPLVVKQQTSADLPDSPASEGQMCRVQGWLGPPPPYSLESICSNPVVQTSHRIRVQDQLQVRSHTEEVYCVEDPPAREQHQQVEPAVNDLSVCEGDPTLAGLSVCGDPTLMVLYRQPHLRLLNPAPG